MDTILVRRALVALAASIVACSSSSTPTQDAAPLPELCPATIQEATATGDGGEGVTSACHVEGWVCGVGFECYDGFYQQATCTCSRQSNGSLAFACTLPAQTVGGSPTPVPPNVGDPVMAGLCVYTVSEAGPDSHGEACPADDTSDEGKPCSNAGQVCTYPSGCVGKPPPVNTCQCVANYADAAGLSWQCDITPCN